MDERLDFLLSVALDDELEPAESDELDRLLADHPEAVARSGSFASIDETLQTIAAASLISSSDVHASAEVEAGLAAMRARLEEVDPGDDGAHSDEVAERRRALPIWVPPFAMAAAAIAIYLAVPQASHLPIEGNAAQPSAASVESSASAESLGVEDPIALAVVFGLDDEPDPIELVDGLSPDDFEIIETLELMEFLAARERESGGRG